MINLIFALSKIFTCIILPPGIFIILLLIAFFACKRFRSLFLFSAIVLYLLCITPTKDLLISHLENVKIDNGSADAVVVLGGGVYPNGYFKSRPEAFERIVYGLILARRHNIPFVFSGGGVKYNESKLVKVDIKHLCKSLGCYFSIYFDNKSLNTYQNGYYTSVLFEKYGLVKNIYLVTTAYHMKRATLIFKHFGFEVHSRPVGFFYEGRYIFWDFLPHMDNFYESYKAIHEIFGILSLKILHGF